MVDLLHGLVILNSAMNNRVRGVGVRVDLLRCRWGLATRAKNSSNDQQNDSEDNHEREPEG